MKSRYKNILLALSAMLLILSACVKGEKDPELGSFARVSAFGIDSIYGKFYHFTIDQVGQNIFNRDSLPVGSDTLLAEIKIDTLTVNGYISSGLDDTLVTTKVMHDLSGAINTPGGVRFKVFPYDMSEYSLYDLDIRIHRMEGDSLHWDNISNLSSLLSKANLGSSLKAVVLGDKLIVYGKASSGKVQAWASPTSDPSNYDFQKISTSTLPSDADLSSATVMEDMLYMRSKTGNALYRSADGSSFEKVETSLDGSIKALIGATGSVLSLLVTEGSSDVYYTMDNDGNLSKGKEAKAGTPSKNISFTSYVSPSGIAKTLIVGSSENQEATIPWFTQGDGDFAELDWTSGDEGSLPAFNHPTLLMHNNSFYAFGDGLKDLYISRNGQYWVPQTSRYLLPEEMAGATNYSAATDKNQFIWVVTTGKTGTKIFRGRLNRLGFSVK